MPGVGRVLVCRCVHAETMPRAALEEVLRRLRDAAIEPEVADDLCELAARSDPRLRELAEADAATVIACYPRAVKWLFAAAEAPLSDGRVALLNLRAESAESIVASLLSRQAANVSGESLILDSGSAIDNRKSAIENRKSAAAAWMPWFPVIDYSRCTNCGQCLNFCLFGVFGRDGRGRVAALRPAKCKTNCPACARVCPEAAIIFPKHATPPINGAEIRPEDLERAKMKTDPTALARGDVYAALRKRGQGSASLAALQERLGIPPEVLAALPAEALRARAQQAMDAQAPPEQAPPCDCDCECHQPGAESVPCDCGKCLLCTCDVRRDAGQ